MSITYKSVYRAKEGKVKKRLDLLIDMDLALKLIEEASRKYGARGISRFVEELLREYFEKQKQEARSKISEIVQSVIEWKNEDWRAGRTPMLNVEKDPKNTTKTYYLSSDGTLKRKVQILIDDELFREASIVAQEIYGRGRGGLSLLISVLLKNFLDDYKANKSIELPDSHRKTVKDIFLEVLNYIAKKRQCSMDEIVDVLEKELIEAIGHVRGTDKRTVKKWIELFMNYKLIQYVGGFNPNRIFRVHKPE